MVLLAKYGIVIDEDDRSRRFLVEILGDRNYTITSFQSFKDLMNKWENREPLDALFVPNVVIYNTEKSDDYGINQDTVVDFKVGLLRRMFPDSLRVVLSTAKVDISPKEFRDGKFVVLEKPSTISDLVELIDF